MKKSISVFSFSIIMFFNISTVSAVENGNYYSEVKDNILNQKEYDEFYDCNNDGKINVFDAIRIKQANYSGSPYNELKNEIIELQTELDNTRSTLSEIIVNNEILKTQYEEKITGLQDEIERLNSELSNEQSDLSKMVEYATQLKVQYDEQIASLNKIVENQTTLKFPNLKSLKLGILGDSISVGVGASEINKTSYAALMQNDFKTVTNYSISGSFIQSGVKNYNSLSEMYVNMSDDLDVILVYGGTNDWYYGTSWGELDSTDTSSFLGALNVLMQGLQNKYIGKEIFFVTPMSSAYADRNTDYPNSIGKTMLDYRNAIIERANYYGIPVIDLYATSGMDVAHNKNHREYYSSDGVHPNDNGHKRVYERIINVIGNTVY